MAESNRAFEARMEPSATKRKPRVGVVLLNLGGPERIQDVGGQQAQQPVTPWSGCHQLRSHALLASIHRIRCSRHQGRPSAACQSAASVAGMTSLATSKRWLI